MTTRLQRWAGIMRRDAVALYLAARDPQTPWYAKALAAMVVAYALSPIDLIPDFIPVLGYLDDLLIVPAALWVVLRLIPAEVMADCRARAETIADRPVSRAGALVVVGLWVVAAVVLGWLIWARVAPLA
jgi:uncharacterized membrane protein YkvA (DUF1232 family)